MQDIQRLSLNQATTQRWGVQAAVEGCARAGIPAIGLWRDKVGEYGVRASARLVHDAGLQVSSLCRGGWFDAPTAAERQARLEDNRRAIEEAAELGTAVLVLVCGPASGRDLAAGRAWVAEAIADLAPFAAQHSVRLGIEPLHPMFAAERSVVVTLAQANALAAPFPPDQVGVIVDVYHVWWDPDVLAQIALAGPRLLGFHVSDWLVPTPDLLLGRGMMGDGIIDIPPLRQAVDSAGYNGPIEVEIFNQALWNMPGDELVRLTIQRFLECV